MDEGAFYDSGEGVCPICGEGVDDGPCPHFVATVADDSELCDDWPFPLNLLVPDGSAPHDALFGAVADFFEALGKVGRRFYVAGPEEREKVKAGVSKLGAVDRRLVERLFVELAGREDEVDEYWYAFDGIEEDVEVWFRGGFDEAHAGEKKVVGYEKSGGPGMDWTGRHYWAADAGLCLKSMMEDLALGAGLLGKVAEKAAG